MKNLKILIPMLACIFAIGMAFTAPDLKEGTEVQAFDYILVNGSWLPVEEQDCLGSGFTCRVQMGTNGPIYDLYDEIDDPQPKSSGTEDPIVIKP
jgi:hypothetical protein